MTSRKWINDDENKKVTFSFSSPKITGINFPKPPHAPMPPHPPGAFGMPKVFQFGSGFVNNTIYQNVEDDILEIIIAMPGIEKSSLKVRSKADKLSIFAELKEEYIGKVGSQNINHSINLIDEVNPDASKAKYKDGVLTIKIPIAEPGKATNVEYEE